MPSGYFVQPTQSCLVTALIQELVKITNEELQRMILVVPTQRLASYILSQVARKRGAFLPPEINTLENLLSKEAARLHPLRIATDGMVEFLLGQKLKQEHYEQVRSGHERELRLILGELYDQRVRHSALPALHQCLAEDIYKNDTHIGSLHQRAAEIEKLLAELEAQLELRGLAVRSRIYAETMEQVAEIWKANLPQQKDRMILCGYTSMAPSWHPLLETLCQREDVMIWLMEQPDIYHRSSPLLELNQFIRQFRSPTYYSKPLVQTKKKTIQILETSSPYQECRAVVKLCQELILQGQDASRLAILVTSEGDYQKYLRSLLKQAEVPCNIALSFPLRDVAIGRWIKLLYELSSKDFHISRLLAWCHLPITSQWWQGRFPDTDFEYQQIAEFLSLKKMIGSWQQLLQETKESAFAELFQSIYQTLQPWLYSEDKSLQQRFLDWEILLTEFAVESHMEDSYKEAIGEAFQSFASFRDELLAHGNWLLNLKDFWTLIDEHFLSADIRSIGEPLSGLQVLSLAESRLFPFDTIFLIGCNEGTFPKALPQDELLDDYLKKKMGLPGWEALESMEDQTFHLLKERIPQLILSRCLFRGREPQVRSRFIEKLITEDDVIIISISSQSDLLKPPPAEHMEKAISLKQVSEGILPIPPAKLCQGVSASALEKLQRCPYRFLLDRLGIRDHKPLPFDDDTRVEGEWLHGVLEAFFTGTYANIKYMAPLHEVSRKFDSQLCMDRLLVLTTMIGPKEITRTPLYYQLSRHSWPAFIQHLQRLYENQWQALTKGQREASFGQSNCIYQANLLLNDSERHLLGRIDSIDFTDGLIIITDYKRRTIPDKKSIITGLSPQLAFYYIALSQQAGVNKDMIMLGYWNVIQGEWAPIAAGKLAKEEALQRGLLKKNARILDLGAIQSATEKLWQWREQDIIAQQRYYADPSECGLCDYENVCRRQESTQNQRIIGQSYLRSEYLKKEPV
ncbi:MAG: PD-(D/E)XK nuclease family protein [Oligoflexus sp.]